MTTTADQNWFTATSGNETAAGVWQKPETTTVFGLPVQKTDDALVRTMAMAGESLEELLDAAAVHFTNPNYRSVANRPTSSDFEALADDDDACS